MWQIESITIRLPKPRRGVRGRTIGVKYGLSLANTWNLAMIIGLALRWTDERILQFVKAEFPRRRKLSERSGRGRGNKKRGVAILPHSNTSIRRPSSAASTRGQDF